MILNALEGRPLPVYGDGKNVRDWLYVEDHARQVAGSTQRACQGKCTTSAATASCRIRCGDGDLIPITTGFTNETVTWRGSGTDTNAQYVPAVFNLSTGTHQLIVVGREAGAELGQMTIAPYTGSRPNPPSPPLNLRIVATQ